MVNKWKTSNVDKDIEMSNPQETTEEVLTEPSYEDWVKAASRDIIGACIAFDKPMNEILNNIARIITKITEEK